MEALLRAGLEIIFSSPLSTHFSGVSPEGAVFPYECIQQWDRITKTIVLQPDFAVNLKNCLEFRSPAPGRPRMLVHPEMIVSIKELATGEVLYPID